MTILILFVSCALVFPVYRFTALYSDRVDLMSLRKKDTRLFIIQCYREVEKKLSRKKLPRHPSCTPSEYRPRVAALQPHLGPSIETIIRLFNHARYSALPVGAVDADSAFEAYQYILKYVDKKPKVRKD